MSGPITQDWEPVVIRKKTPNAAAKKDEKVVNAARRAGAEIETLRKCNNSFYLLCYLLIHIRLQFPIVVILTYFDALM